jgi:Flp pilus assembly protein TadG
MSGRFHRGGWLNAMARRLRADERASQIAEFALSLPLLVVFVVGIFDFSGALSLKQKLTNAAREGARVAAADPATDLSGGATPVPASVADALYVVDNYLKSENLNDCGLGTTEPVPSGSPALTWSATQNSTGCPGSGIILTINRGYYFPQTGATSPTTACHPQTPGTQPAVVGTCVSIQYAYKWRFNSVITLLVPSATYASVSYISTTATAFNEN